MSLKNSVWNFPNHLQRSSYFGSSCNKYAVQIEHRLLKSCNRSIPFAKFRRKWTGSPGSVTSAQQNSTQSANHWEWNIRYGVCHSEICPCLLGSKFTIMTDGSWNCQDGKRRQNQSFSVQAQNLMRHFPDQQVACTNILLELFTGVYQINKSGARKTSARYLQNIIRISIPREQDIDTSLNVFVIKSFITTCVLILPQRVDQIIFSIIWNS